MLNLPRYRVAARAAGIHSLCSLLIAALAAWVVFGIWYAYPYRELSGGRELFLLVVAVDVVCGPLLTLVLFNPQKPRKELILDLSLVAFIQLAALGYGIWTVWEARPLFLVHELDRYKVISAPDIDVEKLKALSENLQPRLWSGPQLVGIRPPKSAEESNTVLFEAAVGGRDYAARPEFYIPYVGDVALSSVQRAKPLSAFLARYPTQLAAAKDLAALKSEDMAAWLYVPVLGRQDWVAIVNKQGQVQGFLPGDGF
jgi:hypothetical protein